MITIVFKDWFTGQYKYEFTLNGDWDRERLHCGYEQDNCLQIPL